MQTAWSITAPEADSTYGLDEPDVTATLTFTDGTSQTVRFGNACTDTEDSLCYLASDAAPTVVYEVNADYKTAYAVTKESLHDETATAETADPADVVAQYPSAAKMISPTACRNDDTTRCPAPGSAFFLPGAGKYATIMLLYSI